MSRTTFSVDIVQACYGRAVDPDLLEALVVVESNGNPWAWRPEPRYRYLWDTWKAQPFRALTPEEIASETAPADFHALAGTPHQEWWAQQASWGLCQIMGALARELGFRSAYLTELLNPQTNLNLGAKHLSSLLRWADGDVGKALGAYNAGRGGALSDAGRAYAQKVLHMQAELDPLTPRRR